MKRTNSWMLLLSLVCVTSPLMVGCGGGGAENTVSEAPAAPTSQEEIDAKAKSYADEAEQMRQRDQQTN